MSADPTGSRYRFPSVPVDDPARALADLASTVKLVDDLAAWVGRVDDAAYDGTYDPQDYSTIRRELVSLRRRLEAIHARLST